MPTQTTDLEYVISDALNQAGTPLTLDALLQRFGTINDPRWVAVALMHLRRDALIRWTTCDADHDHEGSCAVGLIR